MPDNADSLAWVLRLEGFDATTAIYAATALTAASTSVFDAILLDIAMPGMDGYQLAKDLRGLYPVKPLLIAITGYGGDEYRKRSRDEGFDYHIVKPADPFELAALIREHTLAASP
jgi:DNA-binding response OmpR family regulator